MSQLPPTLEHVYFIILCGGSGTRLWPLSRKSFPKQFLSLGGSKKTLLQLTLDRLKNISSPSHCWIVTAKDQEKICISQIEKQISHIVVEPEARNTAPAIAYAAWQLMKKDPQSIMVILPSDHFIQNVRSFEQSIFDAVQLAKHDFFVTIGLPPTYPATGFGYIEKGLPLDALGNILPSQTSIKKSAMGYSVRSFREKPNHAAAEQFIRTGKYLWNSGMFVWKTSTFWRAFSDIKPDMANIIESINENNLVEKYSLLEKESIDVAFIEQTSHIACVPAHFDWNDVGVWSAVSGCFEQDSQGNTIHGDVFTFETKNSVVHTTGPFVSVVGLENIAVVATEDAILVTSLLKSQDVKKVIHHLESENPKLL